jgi:hypothetical protein
VAESESKSESRHDSEPKREPREPRALSAEYHKARKQLMLWAGILFIWELVGIDLEKAKEAGGNFGSIVNAIKSPQAVPWALLILIVYFAFKLRIEWGQCNQIRRQVRESRIDYYSAFIVAAAACALYFAQAISQIQFANVLQRSDRASSLLAGVSIGAFVTLGVTMIDRHKPTLANIICLCFAMIVVSGAPLMVMIIRGELVRKSLVGIGIPIGIAIIAIQNLVMRRRRRSAIG